MKEIPIACFLLAFVFNIVSCVSQEGLGDEVFTDVDACRSNEDLHLRCFHPVVSGGFPFSYAFDRLSVSVPYSIFF